MLMQFAVSGTRLREGAAPILVGSADAGVDALRLTGRFALIQHADGYVVGEIAPADLAQVPVATARAEVAALEATYGAQACYIRNNVNLIRLNRRRPADAHVPVIGLQRGRSGRCRYTAHLVVHATPDSPAWLVTDREHPLKCGAKVYIVFAPGIAYDGAMCAYRDLWLRH